MSVFDEFEWVDEPTAWLREAATKRARVAMLVCADALMHGDVVMTPIGKSGMNDPVEDRTCDRCRTFVPKGVLFHPFKVEYPFPPGRVIVVGGLCGGCAGLERGES